MSDGGDVGRLEAELEIRNLVAALAQLADSGEVDAYLDLFADDAVWEMPANPLTGVEASRRRGRQEIAAGVRERRAAGVQGPGSGSMHVIVNLRIELSNDDTATGHACWLFYAETATAPVLRAVGRYRDSYRRTSSGWKLAHRSVTVG